MGVKLGDVLGGFLYYSSFDSMVYLCGNFYVWDTNGHTNNPQHVPGELWAALVGRTGPHHNATHTADMRAGMAHAIMQSSPRA